MGSRARREQRGAKDAANGGAADRTRRGARGAPEPPPRDWLPMLDAALARLPDRDRWPILLCDLLGRSRAEAAAELGIAEGTLSSRLARSRDKLRARLARLGAVLSLPTLAAVLTDEATATVPGSLIQSTVAAGTSVVAARELAEGVMRTMFLAKVTKLAAVGVCLLGTVTAGIIWLPTAGSEPSLIGKETQKKGAPPAKEAVKADSDLSRIQGTWIVESKKPPETRALRKGGPGRGDPYDGRWENMPMTFDGDRVEFAPFPGKAQTFRLTPPATQQIDLLPRRELRWIPYRRIRRTGRVAAEHYQFDGDKLHRAW